MNYAELVAPVANRCFLGSCEDMGPIPDGVVHLAVTSPPYYGLRDYGTGAWEGGDPDCDHRRRTSQEEGASTLKSSSANANHALEGWKGRCRRCGAKRVDKQIGMEETPREYIERIVRVAREIRRVLRSDGVFYLNLGDAWFGDSPVRTASQDSFSKEWDPEQTRSRGGNRRSAAALDGFQPKSLMLMPARVAIALEDDGWIVRDEIVWQKPNPMPESVTDRTTRCHEMIYMLSKSNVPTFWTHRDGIPGVRDKRPAPDYRWLDLANGEETDVEPPAWRTEKVWIDGEETKRWRRFNLWTGDDYFYDAIAVREPLESGPSDLRKMIVGAARLGGRTLDNDDPLYKANASTNIGKKRGVGGGFQDLRKQDALPDARKIGFNDRYRAGIVLGDPMAGQPTLMEMIEAGYSMNPPPTAEEFREHEEWRGAGRHETPSVPVIGRNRRSVWTIPTRPYKDAHFAVFPPDLPSICIRAGSSEGGCCAECGAPRTRVVRRPAAPAVDGSDLDRFGTGEHGTHRKIGQEYQDWLNENPPETVGFAPSCRCAAPTIPCLVLDPFGGSGTTFEIAEAIGRRWVGFELSEAYHRLIEGRTRQAGLFTSEAAS